MASLESYFVTQLYAGGVGWEDRDGVFTRRTTYGIVTPDRTRAVRVQAERTIGEIYPNSRETCDGFITEIYPITLVEGGGIGFAEGVDSLTPPQGEVTRHFMLGREEGMSTLHTLYRDFENDITPDQRANLSLIVGVAALQMYEQVRHVLGE